MGVDYGRWLIRPERSEIRARIAAGETHWEVAEAVDCSTKTVQRLLVKTGGLPSWNRPRSPLRLLLTEREEISRGLRVGIPAVQSPEGWVGPPPPYPDRSLPTARERDIEPGERTSTPFEPPGVRRFRS